MDDQNKTDLFMDVLENYKGIIYKVANSYCKLPEERKDLVQEIIFQLWRSFERFNIEYKYSTWIYRIALNVAISFYRKEQRRPRGSDWSAGEIFNIPEMGDEQEKERDLNILQQFIAELKEIDKAIMLLYLEEKKYREIGEILGYSETNVATRIGRIKSALKQKFFQKNLNQ